MPSPERVVVAPIQLNCGPNGWSTTIGVMGAGVTVGEGGRFGLSVNVPYTPIEAGVMVQRGGVTAGASVSAAALLKNSNLGPVAGKLAKCRCQT